MARKVTCQICKKKGTSDTFFKVTDDKGKNKYYCSREEYEQYINEREKREKLIKFIAKEILELEEGQIVNPILMKKINELHGFYDYDVIYECFKANKDTIKYWLSTKQFSSEYGMFSYVMKIIESNINDVYKQEEMKKWQEEKIKNNDIDVDLFNDMHELTIKINNIKNKDDITVFLDEEDL